MHPPSYRYYDSSDSNYRPSDNWLENPSHIDGGVFPAVYFSSHSQINEAYFRVMGRIYKELGDDGYPLSLPKEARGVLVRAPLTVPTDHENHSIPAQTPVVPVIANSAPPEITRSVNVSMLYIDTNRPVPLPVSRSRATKKVVKASLTKPANVAFDRMGRIDFVKTFLAAHDIAEDYAIDGFTNGPNFRMWWTGSSGGKTNAITIETDKDFTAALSSINQKSRTCQVSVEFDLDEYEKYKTRRAKRPHDAIIQDDEETQVGAHGTKVPCLDGYSKLEVEYGEIILELKEKWGCESHHGEHGNSGFCWISARGEHIGLNNNRFRTWAEYIHNRLATILVPPNIPLFDLKSSHRDGGTKPRGRNGPSAANTTATSDSSQLLATLASALLAQTVAQTTRGARPQTPPPAEPQSSPVSSPLPKAGSEIRTMLTDLLKKRNVDLRDKEDLLASLDFTPDIIPSVLPERLCTTLDIREGTALKLITFCTLWSTQYDKKSRVQRNT